MLENYELLQKGFRILHPLMAGFIGRELNRVYYGGWWEEVLYTLNDQHDLPSQGEYSELIDSLDIANCLRLIDRKWSDVFRYSLTINHRTWARELMGVRNQVAHIGQQDLADAYAERALDTMALLCAGFDSDGAEEIRALYRMLRERETGNLIASAVLQTKQDGAEGAPSSGVPLLTLVGTQAVQKTELTRKVTYAGKTVVYPVYRVRLDMLYYNDQNDRIATWITRYRAEKGEDALKRLSGEVYNDIIESFIVDSNPDSIQKTQKNIQLVGQREPGVALADGRIVDGNRRFTCLRRIQRSSTEPVYFETVIMDVDIEKDKKQIKLLELAIQHGEEKKVDYDLIDYAIGTYLDVVKTKLLTMDEYAASTNETLPEVRKRVECAEIICEFLEYVHLPEQYHVARDLQVYSLFQEMLPLTRLLDSSQERQQLKTIAFNNILMHALPDQRKFIRDIKMLIKNKTYAAYFEDQMTLNAQIHRDFDQETIRSKMELDQFAQNHETLAEELQLSMHRALLRSRKQQIKVKPSENAAKSLALMKELDTRMFGKMNSSEKSSLSQELQQLGDVIYSYQSILSDEVPSVRPAMNSYGQINGQLKISTADPNRPFVYCVSVGKSITSFFTAVRFTAAAMSENVKGTMECRAFFIDAQGNIISDVHEFKIKVGENLAESFTLQPDAMRLEQCMLVLQDVRKARDEALLLLPFHLHIVSSFG